jgi:hypothetical protein
MAITKVTSSVLSSGSATDGYVLTADGSGNSAWEEVAGGPTFKTFGTDSIMIGDTTTGTIDAANNNTGLGVDVFAALTEGDGNTAIGKSTLTSNTTASYNTAVGYAALTANTTGTENTAVGSNSLDANTIGSYNTACGKNSLTSNTEGNFCSAFGQASLETNTTGTENTSVGHGSLRYNTTASYNTAVGTNSLRFNTTGTSNVAIGYIALTTNTTGSYNAALGQNALGSTTTASSNTGLGYSAGYGNTTGASNTFVGSSAGGSGVIHATGSDNTFIGASSGGTATNTLNANALGSGVKSESGYTTVGLAASDIRAANGVATWATVSDERYKKDITDSTTGLSFINALQPRTFKYKNLGELPETFSAYKADSTEVFKNSDTNHGFIAQEVKAAIDADDSIKDGFKLWDEREDGSQEVAEAALIPVLVKAIQELSAEVETLKSQIGN